MLCLKVGAIFSPASLKIQTSHVSLRWLCFRKSKWRLMIICACLTSSLGLSESVLQLHFVAKPNLIVKLFFIAGEDRGFWLGVRIEVKSEDGGAVRVQGSLPGMQSVVAWWTSAWELTTQGLWFYCVFKQLSVQFDHARHAAEAIVKPLMLVQRVPDRPHFIVTFCCTEIAGCEACGLWGFPCWSAVTPESATW